MLLAPEKLSASGIGPERGALPRGRRRIKPGARRRARRGVKVRSSAESGKVGAVLAPALRGRGTRARGRAASRGRGDGRLHRAGRGRRRTSAARSRPASRASSGRPAGTGRGRRAGPTPGCRVFYAPNFALGAVLMMRFAPRRKHLPRAEIVELHHETKLDAPSGTAKATAEAMGGEVPIHSSAPWDRRAPGGASRRPASS